MSKPPKEVALELEEGDNIKMVCDGMETSFGTRPRQKSRDRVKDDSEWEFLGKVVEVNDDRDRYREEAEARGIDVTDLRVVHEREVLVEGWDSRDDYTEKKTWRLEMYFSEDSDTVSIVEVPDIMDINPSPGANGLLRSEAKEIEVEE